VTRRSATAETDVLVVGLGPVGSTLAGLLGRRGVRVVAVDREPQVFGLPRAAHVDHMGLRTFQELGLLDGLLPDMIPNPGLDFVTAGRRLLMRVPGDQRSRSGLPASMYFHQPRVDRALRAQAAATPSVDLRLGAELTDLEPEPDRVVASLAATGEVSRVRASWVVGCDGASSRVRDLAGLTLEDLSFDEQWLVVDLLLGPATRELPRHAVHVCDPARPHTAIPMPLGRYRFELQVLDGEDPVRLQQPDRVAELLAPYLDPGEATLERAAVYTFHGLVARQWRAGRVLVAGDAAHQMPPFLGQGMCSGLRDATNLAWKLARVVGGTSPADLLDTYESERRPHVRAITRSVVDFGAVICDLDPGSAARRDERILTDPRPPERRLPFRLPRLDPGPLVLPGGGDLFVQPPSTSAGLRLDDVIGPRFLVLARSVEAYGGSAEWWRDVAGALVATTRPPTHGVLAPWSAELEAWMQRHACEVAVVRPDRYVLGTGTDLDDLTSAVGCLLAASESCAPPDRPSATAADGAVLPAGSGR
jgi:3-(3-hydroxy-phenyl)propionate hydroxylase